MSQENIPCDRFELKYAESVANELMQLLKPYFVKYEICGSIRRKKQNVGDIDLVVITKSDLEDKLSETIKQIDPTGEDEAKLLGKKGIKRFLNGDLIKRFKFKEIIIDMYFANNQSFEVLRLIRTGSKNHNIKLTSLAKRNGLKLFAGGQGLCLVDKAGEISKIISIKENEILAILLGVIPSTMEREYG